MLTVILKYLGIVRKDMLSAAIAADWDDEQDSLEVEVLIDGDCLEMFRLSKLAENKEQSNC